MKKVAAEYTGVGGQDFQKPVQEVGRSPELAVTTALSRAQQNEPD